MASIAQWIEGSRPRTWPNALAPVIAGTGAAAAAGGPVWWKALLALAVSVCMIIGVNFANDYSDGIRGTDDDRVGPLRLVGSRLASPAAVKAVAIAFLALAAAAGLALSITTAWWLVAVGAACVAGAWFYTGGSKPYGYSGFGEIAVFIFFGLVAVLGTEYVQTSTVSPIGLALAVAIGSFSSAVLVANNLRDIPTDRESGKITLAVRLGDARTRILFPALLMVPALVSVGLGFGHPWRLLGLVMLPLIVKAARPVVTKAQGPALIPTLRDTGLAMLGWAILTASALAWLS
ncbi:1,4-dihydroxy-2-naphthoate polyprenyltransferase [Mycobacteroides salmoniphilum]|uniref:1,4-dihydroxy-2-naphthoate octaprenyltransferase n=1 Tax=Mycobacteroides salmoniphilum TaxID=404941 RepID=A0A4R8SYP7_9MYCO|nr:1,4-dihydroxy-2-naphthoate polyprenyltransferase [Mycobacteroides salmoniphilum]TDZ92653.1 1,4-dihydroxy-2-naphthoate octaprenyltransferase [Mycobacteroides salmoniphilum]TEA08476.1 1,4-dihydroxy-2-naphthoate octaprenyltransferase [Mycobacteroides salmoniphilum]